MPASPAVPRSAAPVADASHGPRSVKIVAWLQNPWVWALLCIAAALPLLYPTMPPLDDLGGHLGRFAIQLDGGRSADLRQWYSFRWGLLPNLGTDLLVQLLAPALGLEPALKLIVIAIPVIQVAGWLLLARSVHGHVPPLVLLALPLAYGYPFQFGFLNFTLCVALATCALALWITLGNHAKANERWLVFVPIACVLWTCHLAGWALFCVFAGADELMRQRAKGQNWLRAALRCIAPLSCLLSPWLFKLLSPGGAGGHGVTRDFFKIEEKLGYLVMPFRDRWAIWDIGSAVLVLVVIGWSWGSRYFERQAGLALGTACLGLLFVAVPGAVYGSGYADMRLLPTVLAMALISVRPSPVCPTRLASLLAIAWLVFTGARLAGNGASFALFDRQFSQDLALLDGIPRGVEVASIAVEQCHQTWHPWMRERRSHLGGYAIARRHDFSNDQWVIPGGQLLSVHNPAAGYFATDPSQIANPQACRGKAGVLVQAERVPHTIGYLWILEDGRPRAFPGWMPLAASPGSVLYARQGIQRTQSRPISS